MLQWVFRSGSSLSRTLPLMRNHVKRTPVRYMSSDASSAEHTKELMSVLAVCGASVIVAIIGLTQTTKANPMWDDKNYSFIGNKKEE